MNAILGIIGLLIIISALLSRVTERGPVSQVILFVTLGLLLQRVGLFRFPLESVTVVTVGVVTLTLTLFTDAIKMQTEQLKQDWRASLAVLVPGTIFTALAIAGAGIWLLGLGVVPALLLGAILASTDPVLLRDVLRDPRTPQAIRQILTVESGMNDAVALPAVLILGAFLSGRLTGGSQWAVFVAPVFVVSPLIGIVSAVVAIRGLEWVNRRVGVRRDYQSLYSLGVAFLAFAAADRLGGSGLLAAFAAGLTIAVSDLDLCECFLEYGETTAELMMLLTFVLFGTSLVQPALAAVDWRVAAFTALVLFVCRPVVLLLVLHRFTIPFQDKLFAAWLGPRGLNSILLALFVLVTGVPGSDRLFAVTGVVVLTSVFLHGISGTPLVAWAARAPAADLTSVRPEISEVPRITAPALAARLERGERLLIVDVRKPGDLDRDPRRIPTALHLPPDEAVRRLRERAPTEPIVLYCA